MAQGLATEYGGSAAIRDNCLVIPERQAGDVTRDSARPAVLPVDGSGDEERRRAVGLEIRRDGIRHSDSACK
jgi:hypothetical protein